MATIADLAVDADRFALRRSLRAAPETVVDVERVVVVDDSSLAAYFWTFGEDSSRFADAVGEDPSVVEVRLLEDSDDGRFYRARLGEAADCVRFMLQEAGAAVLGARARWPDWRVRAVFPDHESLSAYYDCCGGTDAPVSLRRLFTEHAPRDGLPNSLTDEQREALRVAHDLDYYAIPRQESLADVAEELGVSVQAASKRLRRAHETLAEETLGLATAPSTPL